MARVLLVFGGRSAEHEVSCSSAVSVHDALTGAGHRVIPVGIDRDGSWYLADASFRPFRAEGREVQLSVPAGVLTIAGEQIGFDVAFPVLHGPKGEDGTIQGVFETADVPYVGCGVLGSAMSMDKDMTKQIVSAAGIATAPWLTIRRRDWEDDPGTVTAEAVRSLGFPVFVKPAAQGSSVGISRAASEGELKEAIATALRYDDKVVVETEIAGREIEVGVLDGPVSSVPGEVIVTSGWYTYDAKYADDSSVFEAPARLSQDAARTVRRLAEQVYDVIGLTGLARIDFFYEPGARRFLLNEVNTMPGFTSISGFPKAWTATGMTYEDLCDRLVTAAFDRHERRSRLAIR